MNRRSFLGGSAALIAAMTGCRGAVAAPEADANRVALGTVTMRARFAQTPVPNHPPTTPLTALEVPEYYADRFRLHNLEFWSMHLESPGAPYIAELRKRVDQARSSVVNIQIAQSNRLSDPDETARQESVDVAKAWIDAAASLGAGSARVNTGNGQLHACLRSFRELNTYAEQRGLLLLIENHGGLSGDPDMVVHICKAIDSPNYEVLPDFGNFEGDPMPGLKKLLPHTHHLISAKAMYLTDDMRHTAYDFDACVRLTESMGFRGCYSAEYYDPQGRAVDYEKVADWMLERIRANLD